MKNRISHALKTALIVTFVLAGFSCIVASLFVYRRKRTRGNTSEAPLLMDRHVQVSFQDLHRATNGFSSENLIGFGSFGIVYKGCVDQIEKPIAIKVLKLQQENALKTLIAECNVLKNIRHRNLVKLLSYCSSLDYKGNEFKALIFEFMENGSLDKWLHHDSSSRSSIEQRGNLSLLQRVNILIDVASTLHYLHDLFETAILHCVLKPSNVLLDKDMVAHVSDFGLARILSTDNDASQSQSSTIGIKGTIGYTPLEYGTGSPVSIAGDVYSYGILVLEIFSGKRPTDLIFKDGLNLHNFVKNALPERLMQIVDLTAFAQNMEEPQKMIENRKTRLAKEKASNEKLRANQEKFVLSVLEVGIACSREAPEERMKMGDVVKALHLIRSLFLGVRIYEK